MKFTVYSLQFTEKKRTFSRVRNAHWQLSTTNYQLPRSLRERGFTLVETLVAITVLVVAVTGPLTLASQSLFAAVYAKDQTTAFYLAQEAVEVVRNQRDSNMLAYLSDGSTTWLSGIPTDTPFHVDAAYEPHMSECVSSCLSEKLLHDGTFYNHLSGDATRFGRSVIVVPTSGFTNEATISVTVEWQTGSFREREFTLEEKIYNWIPEQE